MKWEDVSLDARNTMKELGDFTPTANVADKQVKGYMMDDDGGGKVYWNSKDLREMAAHFIEVADYLDNRTD